MKIIGVVNPDPYGGEQEDPAYSNAFKCECGAKNADDCLCEWPQDFPAPGGTNQAEE